MLVFVTNIYVTFIKLDCFYFSYLQNSADQMSRRQGLINIKNLKHSQLPFNMHSEKSY